ncbi:hypothetical protein AMJ40_01520 [candidate division TA06 bacterium DG_26]|uniref:Glycosyltransferase 2-like domain-containing protein n=1 Tax=candidate division TA06 bacterium DG_26 TaxID=1703771 RepID=A0A0S7WL95_UNCT6|nr:MAG: hypothetical protein AMJ40_01520 [candidate division TA06 bacterium DG_26]
MKTVCLIPVYNEEKNLPKLLPQLVALLKREDILMVDDGSEDGSCRVATAYGIHTIRNPNNLGKGNALRSGFRWALNHGYDAVLTIDADCQHDPESIPSMIRAVSAAEADIVVGIRTLSRESMPLHRIVSNKLTSLVVSLLTKRRVRDTQSGFRVMRTNLLRRISLRTSKFEIESELLIRALKRGYRVAEIPIETLYGDEESSISGFPDTVRFILLALKSLFWFAH